MFYSKTTCGFYTREIHGDNIPADAVEITAEQHMSLMQWQSEGKIITADENGYPVLIDPPPTPAPEPKSRFTSLEYLDRFTQDEQEAIVGATYSNVQIKLYYDRLLAATFIDLDDPRTEAGIDALIAAELLAPDRKAALMQPEEIANV